MALYWIQDNRKKINMIITISGVPGSGKSTIAKILSEKLKIKRFSVGDFRRQQAKDKRMSIEEYNKLGEKDRITDSEADEWQIELGKKEDNFIIDGRLSYHFIPNSIKIFLDVKPEIGAERIMLEKRQEEKMSDNKEAIKQWRNRYNSDKKRYKKYYNLNPYDKSQYDFYLDTTHLSIPETTEEVLKFINKKLIHKT